MISKKIWKVKQTDPKLIKQVAMENDLPEVLAAVLVGRGLVQKDKIELYMNPSKEKFYNPFLMKDMEIAVNRIIRARENKEQITIYGDYDVDGITSTSILFLFLKEIGCFVDYYIPDRIQEGYGLNNNALQGLMDRGSQLVITVDTGITAVNEVQYCRERGLDIIITDHHECQEKLPEAIAVLNPKRTDCTYPFELLAGVGVTFKLLQGISKELQVENIIWKYLEIVAIGTVADIVPLQDENRLIVQLAFKTMTNSWNLGLKALMDVAGMKSDKMTAGMIGFQIGPRLNAAGRLGDAKRGVELFTTDDILLAQQIAEELNGENIRRQKMEQDILEQALSMIEARKNIEDEKVLVIASHGWAHGVIGIVASRLVEKYYRPTILLTIEDGIASGSARSVEGFNVFEALSSCKELFVKFGGHEMAAGMSLKEENINELSDRLNAYANQEMDETTLVPKIKADFYLKLNEVDLPFVEKISAFEPYGMGNEEPKFIISGLIKEIKLIGQGNNHVKLELIHEENVLPAIGFNCSHFHEKLSLNYPIDIVGVLNINEWQQKKTPQLIIKDIRLIQAFEVEISDAIHKLSRLDELKVIDHQTVIPKREDYEKTFRYFHNLSAKGINKVSILKLVPINDGANPESLLKYLICLEVFKELELIDYQIDCFEVAFQIFNGKKVELKSSKLYNKWADPK
ncbi:MAG: single-stranded-DNA-specific exonuclease RecJ [Firmicutes bacterium HGW-Firmicutes-1]|jgi:single-stranded-DNA-specific exonuclease|nr:MAG: single-stranded-DNA-specific exonuclease RecJ [Firmicutes bacterium HGW-Firmicutes-1]